MPLNLFARELQSDFNDFVQMNCLAKTVMVLILFGVGIVSSYASLFLSEATNDVYVGICQASREIRGNGSKNDIWVTNSVPLRIDEKLLILPFCKTGSVSLLVPCNKCVFVKFTMRDKIGNEVEKTSEGAQWGRDIGSFPKKPGMKSFDKMAPFNAIAGPDTILFEGWPGGLTLPAPGDLFKVKNGGIYNLTLEINLMKQHKLGTNSWQWDHISLPPTVVIVEKTPEVEAKLSTGIQTNSAAK